MLSRARIIGVALGVVMLAGFIATALRPPLSAVHGDSAIYIYHGKRYAETHLIADYARSAPAIAAKASGATLGDAEFWSPYWHFTRLGHLIVVGSVVSAFGEGIDSIVALHWLWAALAASAVLLAAANAWALATMLGVTLPADRLLLGSLVSAALFTLSEISGYLGRSIVSETPALVIQAAATLVFVAGQKRRSWLASIAAGLLAFALHVVRSEAIWPFLVFLAVLAASQRALGLSRVWYPGYALALASAFAGWLAYGAWMFPLTDPRLFVAFAKLTDVDPDEAGLHRLSASIGLLAVGAVLDIALRGQRRTWLVPLVWAVLALAPTLPHLIEGRSVQTRMFVPYLMLPAFVASTWGWAKLFAIASARRRRLATAIAALVTAALLVVGVPVVYEFVRAQPGLWRVQALNAAVGGWLTLPTWEKHSYDPRELSEAARAIAADRRGGAIIASKGVHYGNLYLLRYFMERYAASAPLLMQGEPVAQRSTCPATPQPSERHRFCTALAPADFARLIRESGGAYVVEPATGAGAGADPEGSFRTTSVYAGKDLRVRYVEPG